MPELQTCEKVVGANEDRVPGAINMDQLLEDRDYVGLDERDSAIGPNSIAKLLFTSGSTGVPKGVMTTHRMLVSTFEQTRLMWPFLEDQPPVILDWLPWSHVFGGTFSIGAVLRYGGIFYIDDGRPIPGEFWKTVRNLKEVEPTYFWSVPKAYEYLAAVLASDADLRRKFFSRLGLMLYAGASLPGPVWAALEKYAEEETGASIPVLTSWGLTETAPSLTIVNRFAAGVGNVGVPVPGLELKLVPNRGKLEARVRGPNVMPGYWGMEEETAKAFDEEGFFRTGDALRFMNESAPERGLRFDGRIAEDFKLSTGTWVNVGEVRTKALAELGGLASNAVVTGPDRDDLGLLIVASPDFDRNDVGYRKRIASALARMNAAAGGSSQRIARALVLETPPSQDTGEMTDKGSLNSRLILEKRRPDVERLYKGQDPDVILPSAARSDVTG
jgi:feruloyl-CoA synthase